MSATQPPPPRRARGRARDWSEPQIAELVIVTPADLERAQDAARDAAIRGGAPGCLADAVPVDADGNPVVLA